MKWIKITDRYPSEDGNYYWRGKRCGGWDYFYVEDKDNETFGFMLIGDIAVNHISEEYFEWLDESDSLTKKMKNEYKRII